MSSRTEQFDQAFQALVTDVASTLAMESALGGKGPLKTPKARGKQKNTSFSHAALSMEPRDPVKIAEVVLKECKRKRKAMEDGTAQRVTDEELFKTARFTDKFKLRPYERFLHYVPRLVNVVTVRCFPCLTRQLKTRVQSDLAARLCVQLAEAIPVAGSGVTLPLDLHRIAARCRNSYYAPKKFSAVQLAYSEPRCRVLVFRESLALKHYNAVL
jgi:hypothetical protein